MRLGETEQLFRADIHPACKGVVNVAYLPELALRVLQGLGFVGILAASSVHLQ